MADDLSSPKLSSSEQANQHYQAGLDLKSRALYDTALTEFRRAVILDPKFTAAQIEIGFLCKEKARWDKMFLRYAFEAFRQAARLDLSRQDVHDQYITLGQQMGQMENLHNEYESWSKNNPENENIKRCYKNVIALQMAMIPQQVNVSDGQASANMQKFILFASMFILLAGFLLILAPPFLVKLGKLDKSTISGFVRIGLFIDAVGLGGILFYTRLK